MVSLPEDRAKASKAVSAFDPKNFYVILFDFGKKGGTTKEFVILYNKVNGESFGPIAKDGLTWPARFMDDALGKLFVAGGLTGLGALIDFNGSDATSFGGSSTSGSAATATAGL